jgi:hypothetical protein
MRLSRRERRVLRRIARQLREEEPALAVMLSVRPKSRQPDFDVARRRRREDMWAFGRVGRRKF